MSIFLMSLVWKTKLSQSQKMVLLALADHANDEGTHCFPAISTLEKKCSVVRRTIIRALNQLEKDGFLRRYERPGRSTNYVLNLHKLRGLVYDDTHDNLAGVSNCHITNDIKSDEPLTNCHTSTDIKSPITTNEPSFGNNNNPAGACAPADEFKVFGSDVDQNQVPEAKEEALRWPAWTQADKKSVGWLLQPIPVEVRQAVLDEVEGARIAGQIRKGLVSYAQGIVKAVVRGTFVPSVGQRVASRRQRAAVPENFSYMHEAKVLEKGRTILSRCKT